MYIATYSYSYIAATDVNRPEKDQVLKPLKFSPSRLYTVRDDAVSSKQQARRQISPLCLYMHGGAR